MHIINYFILLVIFFGGIYSCFLNFSFHLPGNFCLQIVTGDKSFWFELNTEFYLYSEFSVGASYVPGSNFISSFVSSELRKTEVTDSKVLDSKIQY